MLQSSVAFEKAMFTLDEAALLTGRSPWTLRRAIARRELATFRPGGPRGKIYVRSDDLEAYIKRFRTAALDERPEAGA